MPHEGNPGRGRRGHERGHAGHHGGVEAHRQPVVQVHRRAVEERVALGQQHDVASLREVRTDTTLAVVVEVAHGSVVAAGVVDDTGRDGVLQDLLEDAGWEERRSDPPCVRALADTLVIRHHAR